MEDEESYLLDEGWLLKFKEALKRHWEQKIRIYLSISLLKELP